MTGGMFSAPEENTLGVVITGGRGRKQRVKQPRRSGRVANSAHRASLGVAFVYRRPDAGLAR